MLIEERCALWGTPGRAGQDKWPTRVSQRAGGRMINGVPDVARLKVRVLHHIRHRIDRSSEETCRLCRGDSIPLRHGLEPRSIRPLHCGHEVVRYSAWWSHELRMLDEVGTADQ